MKSPIKINKSISWIGMSLLLLLLSSESFAEAQDLGDMAAQISSSFANVAKLITGLSYLAGLGFSIGAILKFKQHKDNPTQIPIGTPIALILISAALLFLPSILGVTGATMFQDATVAGPSGMLFGVSG